MKKATRTKIYISIIIVLAGFGIYWAISTKENSPTLLIKISSTQSCVYDFVVQGDKVEIYSKTISYEIIDSLTTKSDTLIRGYDTILDHSTKDRVDSFTSNFMTAPIDTNENFAWDAYRFEIFINGALKRRKYSRDKTIYSTLETIRPYIKEQRIQCCEFFILFDDILDRQKQKKR